MAKQNKKTVPETADAQEKDTNSTQNTADAQTSHMTKDTKEYFP